MNSCFNVHVFVQAKTSSWNSCLFLFFSFFVKFIDFDLITKCICTHMLSLVKIYSGKLILTPSAIVVYYVAMNPYLEN